MKKEKMIIIDGHSLMHRAFYGLPLLSNSKGLHTNVIYGFVNMINKLIEEYKPDYITIAFDTKSPTFRHTEYADYKAGRKKMADEMSEQIPVLKQVLDAMNIKRLEIEGYEADDILGTVAKQATEHNIFTYIVTGDKDSFQLINENVNVLYTKRGITEVDIYDEKKLMESYEITPTQVPDMKGLMGDASDNIPGVPGIGEKTALDLIKQFGTLENALANSHEIKKKGVKDKIEANKEQAEFSKKLATIIKDVPIEFCMDNCRLQEPDGEALSKLYFELEFRALLEKLSQKGFTKPELDKKQELLEALHIENIYDMKNIMDRINNMKEICFKIFSEKVYIYDLDKIVSMNFNESNTPFIKGIMENPAILKSSYDIKQDIVALKHMGIELEGIGFDIMIAAYIINPSKSAYPMNELAYEFLGIEIGASEEAQFCAMQELVAVLKNRIHETDMEKLYYEIELPLTGVLADMEFYGFKVDGKILEELSREFGAQIEGLTESIYLMAGETFNINSPKQLGVILFEKLNLPALKKTKTGYSTDVEVLEDLSDKHPIAEKILEYRQIVKLKSTYVDGLINLIDSTGRVHSKLNQTVAATGRLSSTEPNLQNIPIKTEAGRQIRRAFVSEDENHLLVDADYSQIELRVLAHISDDERFIDAFINNEDIHTRTASEVFGVAKEEVTSTMRGRAKAINFGIVYGLGDFSLAKDLGITRKEARKYIDNYFERYPNVKKYMTDIVVEAKEKGYVTTLLNRRRFIPEVYSKNAIVRNAGERIAMNTPIQGTAADIIKIAMIKVYNELRSQKLQSRLILQVHDELIIETHKDELELVKDIIKRNMESALTLSVPLTAEVHFGDSWYDAK